MINKEYILFDLDGTITDPFEGITKSFSYALSKFGINESLESLKKVIGPPLTYSFREYFNFNEEDTAQAILYYRERFSTKGIYENILYDGIKELFEKLVASGKKLVLATSKPIEFSEIIMEHFGLTQYFSFMAGSSLKGERDTKAEVIAYALESLDIKDKSQAVMVGDRMHDIVGAKENGIECIAVLYGYGSREEFEEYGADYICDSIESLGELFI